MLSLETQIITDHFSGPVRALGLACLCVQTVTFEQSDLKPRYLACCVVLTLYWSSLKVEIRVMVKDSLQSENEVENM